MEATGLTPPKKAAVAPAKHKKLPACDACKHRRVLCHPVLAPESCPRCIEKRIICSTTPVVRKKPMARTGKRIEEAKAVFGTTGPPPGPSEGSIPGPSSNHTATPPAPASYSPGQPIPPSLENNNNNKHTLPPPQQRQVHPQSQMQPQAQNQSQHSPQIPPFPMPQVDPSHNMIISCYDRDSLLGLAQLSGNLAAHLIDIFRHTPDSFFPLPLLAQGKLSQQFEAVGRRLESLPPDIEVLVNVIMAVSSRISSHPLLLGPGIAAPEYEDLDATGILAPGADLREFGRRRESMCIQFRDQAARMIWERGATVIGGEPNAASCHLMDLLEIREGVATGRSYGSAFACHIRAMSDDTDVVGVSKLSSTGIHWSPFLMQEALVAESHGRAPLFTRGDQVSISGPSPSIDQALHQPVHGLDIRDMMRLFYLPMQAFTHGVTNLARDAAENLVGTVARRLPLNEAYLSTWLANVDTLQALLLLLMNRIGDQLSQTAVAAFAHLPAAENERAFVLRACRFTLPIAWASIILPVYQEMERRVQIARMGVDDSSRRNAERLRVLFSQVKRAAIKGIDTVSRCLLDIPTLGYLTHLHFLKLEQWAKILAEMTTVEEGGEGITRAQKAAEMTLIIGALRRVTFCWPQHCEMVDSLEMASQLESLLQGYVQTPTPGPLSGSTRTSFPFTQQTNLSNPSFVTPPFSGLMEEEAPLYNFNGNSSNGNGISNLNGPHMGNGVPNINSTYTHGNGLAPTPEFLGRSPGSAGGYNWN